MCQLLGMNSLKPAALRFSLAGFAERGGRTGEHADGWGVAFHDGASCRLFAEDRAASTSPIASAVCESAIRSRNIVAHVRKATKGAVARENTHPFVRRLWRRSWSFAHNGTLEDLVLEPQHNFVPHGDTDSERAFCYLLDQLQSRFPLGYPGPQAVRAALAEVAQVLARQGTFNFLLSDGEALYAHRATQLWVVDRVYPFRTARLRDLGIELDLAGHNHLDDRMCVVATEPLTEGEDWQPLPIGEVQLFAGGRRIAPDRQPSQLVFA